VKEEIAEIQEGTRSLRRSAKLALAQHKPRYAGTEPSALLLLQPRPPQLPSGLIEDGDLAPVDKVIWLVLMLRTFEMDGVAFLPTHAELARSSNVAAPETVTRALAMLRCRRWLSVVQSAWRKDGQQRGSAYALHPAPLPIADTLFLDPNYPAFLEKLAGQSYARLRRAASEELARLLK